jgi:hypothetical protein
MCDGVQCKRQYQYHQNDTQLDKVVVLAKEESRDLKFGMLRIKERAFITIAATISLCLVSCSKPSSSESDFKELFSDLSVGVPQYQTFSNFFRPADAIKVDVCSADFSQTESQFRAFAARLGADPAKIMLSNDIWIKAYSKIDPKYP